MGREEKAIAVASLTLFVYAIYIFLLDGAFLFPTPLNSILFGIVAIYIGAINLRAGVTAYLSILIGSLSLMNSRVLMEVVISNETMTSLYETLWPDLSYLAYSLLLILLAVLMIRRQKRNIARFFGILFIISFILILIMNWERYFIFAWLLAVISSQLNRAIRPFDLLWVMLFVLEGMGWINYMIH